MKPFAVGEHEHAMQEPPMEKLVKETPTMEEPTTEEPTIEKPTLEGPSKEQSKPTFLIIPAEIRLLIYHQALPQDVGRQQCGKYTDRQTLLNLAAVCNQIRTEALPVLQNDILNDSTPTPILISSQSVQIFGKEIPISDLIRYTPPAIISLYPKWLLDIGLDCHMAHPPADLRTIPQLNPNYPAAISMRQLRDRKALLEQECSLWIAKGLEWVILHLQESAALPNVSVRLSCDCASCGSEQLSCCWVPPPEGASGNRHALETDMPRIYGQPAFDVAEILEDCRDSIYYPAFSQRLWHGVMFSARPYLSQAPELRTRLYEAWKWLGIDSRKSSTTLGEAMDMVRQIRGPGQPE